MEKYRDNIGNFGTALKAAALGLIAVILIVQIFCQTSLAQKDDALEPSDQKDSGVAAIIPIEGMIDDGLFQSIKRRVNLAREDGADYLVFRIETYGGLVKSADDISKYLILEMPDDIRTVAYINTEAISAGAWISVSCNDIIMRENTKVGDCAPITFGGEEMQTVEREKSESFIRSAFRTAAQANDYPTALLEAMVTQRLKVYRYKNPETGIYEFYNEQDLPEDPNTAGENAPELIDDDDTLVTLTASEAKEYKIAREVVDNIEEALAFLEERDNITFQPNPTVYETLWSEDMVRMINHPSVMGVLFLLMMLGVYMELNTPGLGLPGLVAVISLIIIVGSKYLIGLANWIEIAVFIIGILLLLAEIFLIPGFGIAGLAGIVCIFAGLFGMLIKNTPDEIPWPSGQMEWDLFMNGLMGMMGGFAGFVILAALFAKYMPRMKLFSGLILDPSARAAAMEQDQLDLGEDSTPPAPKSKDTVDPGDIGRVVTAFRPIGEARFGDRVLDVVAQGDFIEKGREVEVLEVHGNRIVVRQKEGDR